MKEYTDEELERITKALDELVEKTQENRKRHLESKEAEDAFVKRVTNT